MNFLGPLKAEHIETKDMPDEYLYEFSLLMGSINPDRMYHLRYRAELLEPLLSLRNCTQLMNPAVLLSLKFLYFSWSWKMT